MNRWCISKWVVNQFRNEAMNASVNARIKERTREPTNEQMNLPCWAQLSQLCRLCTELLRFWQVYKALYCSGLADGWEQWTLLRQPTFQIYRESLTWTLCQPGKLQWIISERFEKELVATGKEFAFFFTCTAQCWSALVSITSSIRLWPSNAWFALSVLPVFSPSPHLLRTFSLCCKVDSILLSSDVDDELKRLAGQCCEQIFIADPCRIR